MKPIECAVACLTLVVLTVDGCSCNTPPPEIVANSATITQPAPSGGGPPEIQAFDMQIIQNKSLTNAAAQAGPSGHVDLDVSNGQLVATPDKNPSHITPLTPTLQLGTSKPVPVVLSPAAQQFMKLHQVSKTR